ncbi:MAG: dihydroorotase family protein [bacterium]|nr:dihydroorotase family protein [bacterium]MDE0602376.1 dihydroorotase family protein [bacterium]
MTVTTTRIRGGTIQTPDGGIKADLLVSGEKVAGLLEPSSPVSADSEIDAAGKWVLPGLIDLHAHTRSPGYEQKEDFLTASRAAAAGGYTTFVDMPNVEPPTVTVELFEQKKAVADELCIVDWGHFVGPTQVDEIPKLAKAGATGFKFFQVTGGYPHDPRLAIADPARLLDTFEAIAETGLLCVVHPFAQTLFESLYHREVAKGRAGDIFTFSDVYTRDIVWRLAVAILLEVQRETGMRMQVVHTHAPGSFRLLAQAKADGVPVTVATDPKYFHLREEDIRSQGARAIPGGAVTTHPDRMAAIWEALDSGVIDIVDSDHAPHLLEELTLMEEDPLIGPFGSPHYEHLFSLMLSDVQAGNLRLGRLIHALTEAPARILGLYPRKGALQPGSDADLVIVDPDLAYQPQDGQMESKSNWTPYHGRDFVGKPILTMLRGTVIYRDGRITVEPGYGRYIAGVPQEQSPERPADMHPGLHMRPMA